ncbi:MAG: DUF1464 family protein [Chloroflexota bacterium]|nr:DUF1464 family protein [Chloroflexota bacterium]
MSLTIGIDYDVASWKTCVMENGRVVDLSSFASPAAMFTSIEHTCARYPEPCIALAMGLGAPLVSPGQLTEQQRSQLIPASWDEHDRLAAQGFLIDIIALNVSSFALPGVRHLPAVPAYRKLRHLDMGSAGKVASVVLLLQRLHEREAAWSEMRFLFLEAHSYARSILVIEDGQVINGTGETVGSLVLPARSTPASEAEGFQQVDEREAAKHGASEAEFEQAFWEGLMQDVAGLLAIHHHEDIVVAGQRAHDLSERLGDTYQLYLFPHSESEPEGFEAPLGAALIIDGLHRSGSAAEVVTRLRIHEVGA